MPVLITLINSNVIHWIIIEITSTGNATKNNCGEACPTKVHIICNLHFVRRFCCDRWKTATFVSTTWIDRITWSFNLGHVQQHQEQHRRTKLNWPPTSQPTSQQQQLSHDRTKLQSILTQLSGSIVTTGDYYFNYTFHRRLNLLLSQLGGGWLQVKYQRIWQ